MTEALRHDSEKVRLDLIPAEQIMLLGQIYTFGAAKYDDNNWMKGMNWRRMIGSMFRHAWSFARGEDNDHESGLSHLGHVAWNALCLYSYAVRGLGTDDRIKD